MKNLLALLFVALAIAPHMLVTVGLISIQSGALLMLCVIASSAATFELLNRSADHAE